VITKKKLSYQVGVLLVAFAHSIVNIVMYVFISRLEVSLLVEFTKSLVLLAIGSFFASSAVRMLGWKTKAKFVGYPITVLVFGTLVGCLIWSYFYTPTHKDGECSDIPLLIVSLIHLSLSWTFAIVSAYLVFLLRDRRGSAMLSMSSEYKARHKKPMATLACVYAFSATVNAVTRIYLMIVSTGGCKPAFDATDPAWIWVATFYRIIDIFVPLWTLLWYFVHTVKRHAKPEMTMDVNNVFEFSDHMEGDSESPSPNAGLLQGYTHLPRKFAPQQPFAAHSVYKTYNVSRNNTSSEEEPGLYTDYSGEDKSEMSSASGFGPKS